ncbi:hypothetical protein BSG1_10663 [Bacillus sp. SG-1]|nr:hypothetical protein BSG1_10663 [Bacillus sp. SG-1]
MGSPCESRTSPGKPKSTRSGALFLYIEKKKGEILKQIPVLRRSEDGEEQEGRGREGENTGVGSAHEDVNERSGRRDSPLIAVRAFSADGSWAPL